MAGDRSALINGVRMAVGEPIMLESIELPVSELRTQDSENPVGDGLMFGRDRLTPGSMTLNILVTGTDSAKVNAQWLRLKRAWNTAVDRSKPGALAPLWWQDGGVSRIAYGRPRALAPNVEYSRAGLIRVTASFKLGDATIYDGAATERRIRIDAVPPSTGGLSAPLVAPLTAFGYAERQGLVPDTGGVAPTPFRVEFHGPIDDPFLRGPGWRIRLGTRLAWDETAIVDTRLGTAVSSLGRNLKSTLDANSRLRDVRLAAGRTELQFGGTDLTGTSYCEVFWRPADYI